jgi:carbonic anhydrase
MWTTNSCVEYHGDFYYLISTFRSMEVQIVTNILESNKGTLTRDFFAGWAVFLIAVPVSIGIAESFNVSLYAGLISGIIGGIVVGLISGSQTSISGPSAGLSFIILNEIAALKSFDTFLLALFIAGLFQVAFGLLRLGSVSYFFPSCVVKGLIAAVGVILILKQIPHLLGHDTDPIGEMSFWQPDSQNTFSEVLMISGDMHFGAIAIGLVSIIILFVWEFSENRNLRSIPAPIVVVIVGSLLGLLLARLDVTWSVEARHFFYVPIPEATATSWIYFRVPNWSQWSNPTVYLAGFAIAVVASLETLLNLDATDRLDPEQRNSPPSRELIAQGIGNSLCGLLGGVPITSRVVHSNTGMLSGARTKWTAVIHGFLFLLGALFLPVYLNHIPLACISAILLFVGIKMASPRLFLEMWKEGRYQFIPFIVTVVAIVFSEKLVGAVIGLSFGIAFILNSNLRRPLKRTEEKHASGELIRIDLATQVTFLNRGVLEKTLREIPSGKHLLLDASNSDYIDPDVLMLIREFKNRIAPKQGVEVSLRGFKDKYSLADEIRFVDYTTRELQQDLTPRDVLGILQEGNLRFQLGQGLFRDYSTQLKTAGQGQFPFAAVLSCIDSRAPVETILDLGLGDIFSIRIAGNVVGPKVLGSLEYACGVAGSKLILVLGHTKCGAVNASVNFACTKGDPEVMTGCKHLAAIVNRVTASIDQEKCVLVNDMPPDEKDRFIEDVCRANVLHSVQEVVDHSPILRRLSEEGKIALVGAMYDVASGKIDFYVDHAIGLPCVPAG